jgi:hypothetical protein
MNRPGQFTSVTPDGGSAVSLNDTTVVYWTGGIPAHAIGFTLAATDPESDALTYSASYLKSGMSFNTSSHHFSWTNPAFPGDYYVKFIVTQPSGGVDALIVGIHIANPLRFGAIGTPLSATEIRIETPNPTHGPFVANVLGPASVVTRLSIFDVAGRHVAEVRGKAGKTLVWDGKMSTGTPVVGGLYLYRIQAGATTRGGKVLIVR